MYEFLEEFRAELLRQDRSPTTIKHYINDIDLFGRWVESSYGGRIQSTQDGAEGDNRVSELPDYGSVCQCQHN